MKRYSAAQARQNFAALLDAAEQGNKIVIERRGTLFALSAGRSPKRTKRRVLVAHVDPAVDAGNWTWSLGPTGLHFTAKSKR